MITPRPIRGLRLLSAAQVAPDRWLFTYLRTTPGVGQWTVPNAKHYAAYGVVAGVTVGQSGDRILVRVSLKEDGNGR